MKNLFLLLLLLFCFVLEAQNMNWVPSSELVGKQCVDQTDCSQNLVCYSLTYMPTKSGVMTSYTTGFTVNCDGGSTAVVYNASCTMNDKSEQLSACEEAGKMLLFCSGNTGDLVVNADKRVVLHQICVRTSTSASEIVFEPNDVVGLTASLDNEQTGPVTEEMRADKFYLPPNANVCGGTTTNTSPDVAYDPGAETEGNFGLELFPNPVVNELSVRFNLPVEQKKFSILDVNGKLILQRTGVTAVINRVDVSALPSGTYFLALDGDLSGLTRKFVIVR